MFVLEAAGLTKHFTARRGVFGGSAAVAPQRDWRRGRAWDREGDLPVTRVFGPREVLRPPDRIDAVRTIW